MRKVSLFAVFVLLCASFAVAQESKGEFFAGYSYMHVDCGSGCTDSSFPAGFNLDGSYYFSRLLGVTADFDYHHKSLSDIAPDATGRTFGLHFGPRVKARMGKIEPFGHALLGFTDLGISASGSSVSDKAFSMKLGGGVDVNASRRFAIRLGEFNYYRTSFGMSSSVDPNGQDHQNNYSFSAGVVLR
jgi:opacity protein-like surface antigen